MRILIVDDNASMRSLLSALLGSQGHTVVGALADGAQLLDTIRDTAPELVCLDYELPGRNGLELLAEINAAMPQIDVVMITAAEDPSVRHRAADAGAAGFIEKPFGQGQILDELEQIRAARAQAAAANAKADAAPPPAATASAPEPAAAVAPAAALPFDRRTVVIADDNGSIRLLLKGLLAELGLQVVQLVANGGEAVVAVRTHRPGILCLDVDMPVMSGLDALPLIREASPQTAVVMVTANASRDFVAKAVAGGARGYIIKPLRPAYIEAFMKKLLQ